ncbi:MAG: ribonuclease Y [Chloroflexi bacterium RBG_19FT_COMBO_47_15]|nr:MAG: ribonuclease Y [Chloroflexi bacterium RBG_19FT_COMBO_47_15]
MVGLILILGLLFGYFARQILANQQLRRTQSEAKRLLEEAAAANEDMLRRAREEANKVRAAAEADSRERRFELQRLERRFAQKEEKLENKLEALERRERGLGNREREIEAAKAQIEEIRAKQLQRLELISGISSDDAKQELLRAIEEEIREEASRRVREWESRIKGEIDDKAREILATTIQRCATDVVSETTVSVVPLPSDDMKGRLIGREGRNIRALEQATGVDLIIDDTPEAVTISSFDPIRREITRVALNNLILDGRIHPARIEEVVEKAKNEVETTVRNEGEHAMREVGVVGLHPELIKLIGRLKFRSSYGQNVLTHSLEVAHFAGMLAAEIGADVALAKKAGLLHDIGKAVGHEVEGTHASIGADLVKQWDKSSEVVQAVAEHHGEATTTSALGFIVATADAISGSRLGARRESLDQYLKRIEALESVANSFPGVDKAFAIQAGREVRILVKPEQVDDLGAMRLARDIVKKIEDTMAYPGQIKVTVMRETRAVDYAK